MKQISWLHTLARLRQRLLGRRRTADAGECPEAAHLHARHRPDCLYALHAVPSARAGGAVFASYLRRRARRTGRNCGRTRASGTCRRGCPNRAMASSSDRAGCPTTRWRRCSVGSPRERWRAIRAICRRRRPFRQAGSSARLILSSPRRARIRCAPVMSTSSATWSSRWRSPRAATSVLSSSSQARPTPSITP